jgi:hypothetical protein
MSPLEALAQLVERCEHAPILQGNEGMRGPLLAEAKAVLLEHGIETPAPKPGSTYQGWLTFKGTPFCIVAEEKDRPKLTEALGLLLRASHEAGYGRGDGSEPPVSRDLRVFDRDITISGPAASVVAVGAVVAWLKSALQAIEPAAPIPDPEEHTHLGPVGGGCTLPKI